MNQEQIIGTAFEYAEIRALSARIANDLSKLAELMVMYKRPDDEIKKLIDTKMLTTEYHYTYTSSGLKKLLSI
jgi:hypothetical protein